MYFMEPRVFGILHVVWSDRPLSTGISMNSLGCAATPIV